MTSFNKDIIFLYRFDLRDPALKYGKISLSTFSDMDKTLVESIKEIVIDVINNSNKTWQIDYHDISLSIINVMDRKSNLLEDKNESDPFIFSIFIDFIQHNDVKCYYESDLISISEYIE